MEVNQIKQIFLMALKKDDSGLDSLIDQIVENMPLDERVKFFADS